MKHKIKHIHFVGIGGSGGVYEGPARLVRNFDDLFDLQEGDVLVTSATGEAFNAFLSLLGAAVTDHGSFASHAAIIGSACQWSGVPIRHTSRSRSFSISR